MTKKRRSRKRFITLKKGLKNIFVVDSKGMLSVINTVPLFYKYNQLSTGQLLYLLNNRPSIGFHAELQNLSRMSLGSAIDNLKMVAYSDLCILGETGYLTESQYRKLLVKLLTTLDELEFIKNQIENL